MLQLLRMRKKKCNGSPKCRSLEVSKYLSVDILNCRSVSVDVLYARSDKFNTIKTMVVRCLRPQRMTEVSQNIN